MTNNIYLLFFSVSDLQNSKEIHLYFSKLVLFPQEPFFLLLRKIYDEMRANTFPMNIGTYELIDEKKGKNYQKSKQTLKKFTVKKDPVNFHKYQ